MRALEALIIAAALGACTNVSQIPVDSSSGSAVILFRSGGDNWLVTDRPDKGTILVQRDSMTARRSGAALTRESYENAAVAYLRADRTCRIKTSSQVSQQAWEFAYECPARPIASASSGKAR